MGVERGDRVVAYMPNIPETIAAFLATASLGAVWSSCSPDFGARSRRRPLRADRAEGAADGRRLPLRRQGPRPQRADRARAGRDALAGAHGDARLPRRRRGRLGRGVPAHRRGAHVRARALRPPDVGPLLLGHHRPAEGDRALAGRDPARAPQEAQPARRRAGGRPRLLVHHHGLDDVELPRRHPAHGRLDRALRRQPRDARHGRAVGARRADRDDLLRHQRRLPRRLHEGRGRARQGPRPVGAAQRRLDRLAARARGLRVGLRAARQGDVAVLHQRRHRHVHRVRRRRAAAAGLPRRAAGPRRWGRRSRPTTRTATPSSTRSASS